MNATDTAFELKDVKQVMDFTFFNLHLQVRELFPLRSRHLKLEKNISHICYNIIFPPFLFHFYIFCLDQRGIRETKTGLARVLNCRT